MTVTMNDPVTVGPGAWMITWSSDVSDPTFNIFKNGKHVASTQMTRLTLMCEPSDVIEVADDTLVPSEGADAAIEISWPAVASTDSYKVEEESSPGSGTWTVRAKVPDDGASRFSFKTAPLVDDIATVFRVTPIGTNGNDGTPTSFNVTVPRHPSAPDVTFTFSDVTKKVTVAAT